MDLKYIKTRELKTILTFYKNINWWYIRIKVDQDINIAKEGSVVSISQYSLL